MKNKLVIGLAVGTLFVVGCALKTTPPYVKRVSSSSCEVAVVPYHHARLHIYGQDITNEAKVCCNKYGKKAVTPGSQLEGKCEEWTYSLLFPNHKLACEEYIYVYACVEN